MESSDILHSKKMNRYNRNMPLITWIYIAFQARISPNLGPIATNFLLLYNIKKKEIEWVELGWMWLILEIGDGWQHNYGCVVNR